MANCPHCKQEHTEGQRFCPVTGKIVSADRFFPPGTMLEGKYRIGRLLGAGGMGAVFEATHVLLNKQVAIKVLLPDLSGDREMSARMVREARAASATGHRNIVMVTDMGWTDDEALFVVMEYLAGHTFDELIKDAGQLPLPHASSLIVQALTGLAVVHKKGIIHRDLKPENLMVVHGDEGELVKILDFGISKIMEGNDQRLDLTRTGSVMGTPQYMSPEQARGASGLDHRADIYAMGAILYTSLAGRPPLIADNYNQMLIRILEGNVPPLRSAVPSLPPQVEAVVNRAMALNPDDRYPDALSFREALVPFTQPALADLPPAAAQFGRTTADVAVASSAAANLHASASPRTNATVPIVADDVSADSLVALDEASAPGSNDRMPGAVRDAAVARAARLQPAGSQNAAPAKAAALPDHLFRPQTQAAEAALELDIDAVAKQRQETRPEEREVLAAAAPVRGTVYQGQGTKANTSKHMKNIVIVVALGVLGFFAYSQRHRFLGATEKKAPQRNTPVLILVETNPETADIYVDGVREHSNSIQLPRSSTHRYQFEVRAKGFQAETFEITPSRSQNLIVNLKKRAKRRRR